MIRPKREHPRSAPGTWVYVAEGVSTELREEFKDQFAYALYNPFVVALAAGTLKMESLLNYLGRDVYYLEKYVEACTIAEDCTDPGDVKEELKTHIKHTKDYANESQKWISAKECPNMAAVDYTRFLLATAAGKVEGGRKGPSERWDPVDKTKIPAYTICSITPCSRLYRFLGNEIAKALENNRGDHPYQQWIEMIFPDGKKPLKIEQMLDKLAEPLLKDDDIKSLLGRLYYHALNLEIQFFAAVPLYQRTLVPLLKQSVLSNCRYTIYLLCFGTEAGQTHVEPSQKENTSDFKRLCNYFRLVTHPETNAGSKVVGSGDPQDLKEIARQLEQIRREINSSNVDMHIVSVRSGDLHIGRSAESAMEKLAIFENIQSPAEKNGMQHISIYIGYKEDVVPRLLEADIGILIRTSSQPARSKKSEVSFVSLFHGVLQQESAYAEGYSWKKQNSTIYIVSSWSEIFAFLFGTYN